MQLTFLEVAFVAGFTAVVSALLIIGLRPFFLRYALARPNARSSHSKPTPQGGGIAVVGSMIAVLAAGPLLFSGLLGDPTRVAIVIASAVGLAIVGATDDVRPLEPLPRLLLQVVAVTIVIAAMPGELRVFPALPWWVERACMLAGGVWLVNLVNFMDGIDWITVVEIVPIAAALAVFGVLGALPQDATIVAVALCGAMIGFAPFNRPVAQLFLGDVGSLPIGLLLGWLLALLAGSGHITAAILLPLYHLADATITLLRRLFRGEPVTQAHRSHYYQRAMDGGLTVYQIVGRIFGVNILLIGLAFISLMNTARLTQVVLLLLGSMLVGALLWSFNCGKQPGR